MVGTDVEESVAQFPPRDQQFSIDMDAVTFGARLRLARLKAGFKSARALSEVVEISDSNIRLYEKDEQEPKSSVLVRLASACKVSVDWLLRGEGPMEYLPVGHVTAEGHEVVQGPAFPLQHEGSIDAGILAAAIDAADAIIVGAGKKLEPRRRAQIISFIYKYLEDVQNKVEEESKNDELVEK